MEIDEYLNTDVIELFDNEKEDFIRNADKLNNGLFILVNNLNSLDEHKTNKLLNLLKLNIKNLNYSIYKIIEKSSTINKYINYDNFIDDLINLK